MLCKVFLLLCWRWLTLQGPEFFIMKPQPPWLSYFREGGHCSRHPLGLATSEKTHYEFLKSTRRPMSYLARKPRYALQFGMKIMRLLTCNMFLSHSPQHHLFKLFPKYPSRQEEKRPHNPENDGEYPDGKRWWLIGDLDWVSSFLHGPSPILAIVGRCLRGDPADGS